nr:MAG TPA: hypothetical protein [Bacteriophage sp.]
MNCLTIVASIKILSICWQLKIVSSPCCISCCIVLYFNINNHVKTELKIMKILYLRYFYGFQIIS